MARSSDDRRAALAAGADAEEYVAGLLDARGWTIVARNWLGGGGELDIVVADGGRLRVVEVKLREPDDPVGIEAIDHHKQRRLARAARAFLVDYEDVVDEVCFMVALVEPQADGSFHVTWIDDAFDA